MKFVGWAVSAGLILAASAASAQMLAPNDARRSPYAPASDFDAPPYPGGPPPQEPGDSYGPDYGPSHGRPGYGGPGYGGPGYDRPGYDRDRPAYGGPAYGPSYAPSYGPEIIPPQEVYAVLRESGFSPLGVPHLRGYVYMIAALDRNGEDGRLIIDARTGRILRFMPASRWGSNGDRDKSAAYGAQAYGPQAALPPPTPIQGAPRPPALIPHVAGRSVPMPVAKPSTRQPSEPTQQSAAVQQKLPSAPPPQASGTVGQARPVPPIQPTQPMPQVQGLD